MRPDIHKPYVLFLEPRPYSPFYNPNGIALSTTQTAQQIFILFSLFYLLEGLVVEFETLFC